MQQLQEDILQGARVVLSTVSMAGSSSMAEAGGFDLCVIDEAAQLVEAESCIVVARWPGLRSLVLVGDHQQLPATVISQEAKRQGYGRSMFERLVEAGLR
jgi:superfamily I DNA and/or RNA helicase